MSVLDEVVSTLDRVTVFRRGAVVTRSATVPAGARRVLLGNLPLCLADASVRVTAEGHTRATGARVLLRTVDQASQNAAQNAAEDRAPAEDEELIAAKLALDALAFEKALVDGDVAAVARLEIPERHTPRDGAPVDSPHEARLALAEFRDRRLAALHERQDRLAASLEEAERRHRMLADRRARDTSARETEPDELRKAVAIHFEEALSEPTRVTVSYEVPGARWAPSYVLRIDGKRARLELRAVVAQRSGEDWQGVELTVSTANPARFVEVPELPSRRIGRVQRRASDRGWRPPPADTASLLDDYRRAVASTPGEADEPPVGTAAPVPVDVVSHRERLLAEAPRAALEEVAGDAPAAGLAAAAPPLAAPAAAMPQSLSRAARAPSKRRAVMFEDAPAAFGSALVAEQAAILDAPPEAVASTTPADDWLDYGRLRLAPPHETTGRLAPASVELLHAEMIHLEVNVLRVALVRAVDRANRVEALPAALSLPGPDDYDYAYPAGAPVDVPADGAFHSLPICAAEADMETSLVVVPRVSTDAYRRAELDNPLAGPLLPGPIDVYVGRDFLTSSQVRFTPPNGALHLGLGVEQGLKVARNARFEEAPAGLMGGSLLLQHDVEIELANHLPSSVRVEVRERIPVLRDKEDDIKLTVRDVEPDWEPHEPTEEPLRGGYRWRLELPAGDERLLRFGYDIRIAAKNELVGGNRREG